MIALHRGQPGLPMGGGGEGGVLTVLLMPRLLRRVSIGGAKSRAPELFVVSLRYSASSCGGGGTTDSRQGRVHISCAFRVF